MHILIETIANTEVQYRFCIDDTDIDCGHHVLIPRLCRADLGEFSIILAVRILGKSPANFSANLDGDFSANFSALFLQGFRPPPKKNSHAQNSRPKSYTFSPIFCLRGRTTYPRLLLSLRLRWAKSRDPNRESLAI